MPPKATPDKMFSADVVAAILYSTGKTSLSMENYKMMSALDGTKTANAFQHDLRSVLATAKKLKERVDNGEKFEPVQPGAKRGPSSAPATPASTTKKRKGNPAANADMQESPSKAKKSRLDTPTADATHDYPDDAYDFIKKEKLWENGYV